MRLATINTPRGDTARGGEKEGGAMQGILKKQRGDRSKDAAPNLTMMTPNLILIKYRGQICNKL